MMSKRRLFAGLTSLTWNLWRSHFSASGPSGIFASSVMSISLVLARFRRRLRVRTLEIDEAELHRDGEAQVADQDDRREARREPAAQAVVAGVGDAHALEHRPGPVVQVDAQRDVRERVDDSHRHALQA